MRLLLSFLLLILSSSLFAKDDNDFIITGLPPFYEDSLFNTLSRPNNSWWQELNDNILDSLISLAIANNQDLRAALDNILIARASHKIVQSNFYPSLNFDRGWSKTQSSRNTTSETNYGDVTQSGFSFAINASWEIDIFGRIISQSKEAKAQYLSEIETYNAAIMLLTADLATYYGNLRTMQQQLIVAEQNIASQKEILGITEVRYNSGLASQLDVAQAKSIYYSTKASIPILKSSIKQQINTIAQLTGEFPPAFDSWLSKPANIPQHIKFVSIGNSSEVLVNRPDVLAAIHNVKAAKQNIVTSKRQFMPQFFLDGSFGFAGYRLNRTFNSNSITYNISPRISWNIFNGISNFNSLKMSKANYDVAVRNYNSVVLKAANEVSNALSLYNGRIEQLVSLRELVVQGELMLTLSLDLYKRGLTNFQNVLDAQRSLLEYQNSLVSAEGNTLTALIDLYRSLGCGWQEFQYAGR